MLVQINNARNKPAQLSPNPLKPHEIEKINLYPSFWASSPDVMPKQEKGTRLSCALPYQLFAACNLDAIRENIELILNRERNFGQKSNSEPFFVCILQIFIKEKLVKPELCLTAGDKITDVIKLDHFADSNMILK